jgi:hypothetical protein
MESVRKIYFFILACLLQTCFCSDNVEKFYYYGIKADTPIIIDGKLDELSWGKASEIIFKENLTGINVDDSTIITKLKSCYDEQNFYIAFTCYDKDIMATLENRDDYLWEEEVVEVFIDTDDEPDTYIEIEVSPLNVLFDSYIVNPREINFEKTAMFDLKDIQTAVSIDGTINNHGDKDEKWVVEIAIPFKNMFGLDIGGNIKEKELKINFYRIDRNKFEEVGRYAWSPTFGSFHTPERFGVYRFN